MPKCTNCGKEDIHKWIFRGRNYCKDHYEEHIEQELELKAFLAFQSMQKEWDNLHTLSDDDFDRLMKL